MKVEIEDYNGNTIVTLDYSKESSNFQSICEGVEVIHEQYFDLADMEEEDHARFQINEFVIHPYQKRNAVVSLITTLNGYFI